MTVHIILPISARKVLYELLKIFLIYHLEMKTSTQQDIYIPRFLRPDYFRTPPFIYADSSTPSAKPHKPP